MSYWKHYERFFVSMMKAFYGDAASAENNWCYDWLPKLSEPLYDVLYAVNDMTKGKMTGAFCQGFNILAAFPNKAKVLDGLSKLKWLVIMDPLATETGEFWKNHGEFNDVDPSQIQTAVFRLPTTTFAEDDGSITNSSRWLQWHHQAAPPPGEAKTDTAILAGLFHRLQKLYQQEGGAFPEPILNLTWDYSDPAHPAASELAKEYNGRALADIDDQGRIIRRKGELLNDFGELRADGSTSCGCWIYSSAWTEQGNMMDRRDNSDPYDIGVTLGWAWAWPLNRRILYNRASARPDGTPWDPNRALVWWNGERWVGADVPDYPVAAPPEDDVKPFILTESGTGHFFASEWLGEGPFPEHYEASGIADPQQSAAPRQSAGLPQPGCPHLRRRSTYLRHLRRVSVCGDHLPPHRTLPLLDDPRAAQRHRPAGKVRRDRRGAGWRAGHRRGEKVRVRSKRGHIDAVAVVTKRLRPLQVDGRTVHQVGIPIHWGFTGVARKAHLTNTLTPSWATATPRPGIQVVPGERREAIGDA